LPAFGGAFKKKIGALSIPVEPVRRFHEPAEPPTFRTSVEAVLPTFQGDSHDLDHR
jgi:hypothetical protein